MGNDKLYAWGSNIAKQCNPGSDKSAFASPTLVNVFGDKKIKTIKCGAWHSCVITQSSEYLMFGSDQHRACAASIGDVNYISNINNKICKLFGSEDVVIDGIFLGWNSTQILVSRKKTKETENQDEYKGDDEDDEEGFGLKMKETMMGFVDDD